MKKFITFLTTIGLILTIVSCTAEENTQSTKEVTPLRFAVTDIEGLEQLQIDFGPFKEALESYTNLPFEFFAINNRTAVVEALKAEKVDIVMAGPAEYVVIANRTGAKPVVGFQRKNYSSAIITMQDSGIETLADLKDKKVAFEDVGSTSRHLMPMQLFADAGMDPLKDIEVIHTSKTIMHEALKKGDIAAMAQSYYSWLEGSYAKEPPEVQEQFKVVLESETLPSDVMVIGTHVDTETAEIIRKAFSDHKDELLNALTSSVENEKYLETKFILDIEDSDYDRVRQMYVTAGYPQYRAFIEE